MRFHCIIDPVVPCMEDCAANSFNQFARRFAIMLASYGHAVFFYGTVPTILPPVDPSRIFSTLTIEDYDE